MLQFTQPIYLLIIIPVAYFIYREVKTSLADMSPFRFKLAVIIRSIIMLLLIMSLAGTRAVRNVNDQSIIFAIDISDSISGSKKEEALSYVNTALKNIKSNQKAAVVIFGGDASIEQSMGSIKKIGRVYSVPAKNNTDIAKAIGLSMAMFPERSAGKIVLLTDGNETRGKALEQAMLAGSNNISIDTIPITDDIANDASLDKMTSPPVAKIGEPFDLKVIASSKTPIQGTITIMRNGSPADKKGVILSKGKNVIAFKQSINKAGSYNYTAVLETKSDMRPENNIAMAYVMVRGKPKALYIEGTPNQNRYLENTLKKADIETDTGNRHKLPLSITETQKYDLVILSDIPAWDMIPEQMMMFRSAVKDMGIGLAMIGGENSFGAGGYFDTPIEEALPVDMSLRKTKALPSLSIVIVMDKSGSMGMVENGIEKIKLANNAAASVVKLLQPIDKVGIVVCHSYPMVAVPLRNAEDKDSIYSQISTIRAEGGGISVFPSLDMAYNIIKDSNTKQKHIILLADGSDCDDKEGSVPLAKKMANERITLSVVSIGDGPDVGFLKDAAAAGKGNFYLTARAQDLKAIFTKDVLSVSKSLIIEEPFIPIIDPSADELSGIDQESIPPLLGYVATSAKPTANILAKSPKKDPILATWQVGVGKSAAFTSDCKARWGARWLEWDGYNKFWLQTLRSIMRRDTTSDLQTVASIDSGMGHVTVDAINSRGEFRNMLNISGSLIPPDMKSVPLRIEQTGPGRYEADFRADSIGTYIISVKDNSTPNSSANINAISIPYSSEYKNSSPNIDLLKQISVETSGVFNPKPADAMKQNFRETKAYSDLWQLFALIAIFLLPFDIAVRRISLEPGQLSRFAVSLLRRINIKRRSNSTDSEEKTPAVTETLLIAKKRMRKEEPVSIIIDEPQKPVKETDSAADEKLSIESSDAQYTSRLLDAKRKRDERR